MTIFKNKEDGKLYLMAQGGNCMCRGQACGNIQAQQYPQGGSWIKVPNSKKKDYYPVAYR